ncbi:hypothetical protein D0T84_07955 [Dysgonomonas sp. 521]|uniref:hypothetical protein n=1 Tax=Dysgonomonas sp. 521 TaxID=2302932 RepID=UPI0013D02E7D|nr:hypothetical protein [Dysgonomonas sp. 521]NDV94851.1 hypothetical protein [Dysgonomonas sp. 521]
MNIVTFEQAKKLNDLGFTQRVEHTYCLHQKSGNHRLMSPFGRMDYNQNNNRDNSEKVAVYYSAPTISEALQWIRDNKGIYCGIGCGYDVDNEIYYHGHFFTDNPYFVCEDIYENTYPKAESALLDAVLTYLIEKI